MPGNLSIYCRLFPLTERKGNVFCPLLATVYLFPAPTTHRPGACTPTPPRTFAIHHSPPLDRLRSAPSTQGTFAIEPMGATRQRPLAYARIGPGTTVSITRMGRVTHWIHPIGPVLTPSAAGVTRMPHWGAIRTHSGVGGGGYSP